jgi:putative acetyltransferase
MAVVIAEEHPLTPDLSLLFDRHTAAMHADTPPESIHMMDKGALADPGIRFFVLRDGGEPLAMGAVKRLDAGQGEIKSMHVLAEARGRGLSKVMLDHLLAEARKDGLGRLSLETGSQPMFQPARRLYERAGFAECPPFGDYVEDPNSVYMTKMLA